MNILYIALKHVIGDFENVITFKFRDFLTIEEISQNLVLLIFLRNLNIS